MPAGKHKIEKVEKDLLKRYFESNVTIQEEQTVSAWLMDPLNQPEVLEYIEASWREDDFKNEQVADFDPMFEKAQAGEGAKVVPLNRRRWMWAASAAACVLLLATGTWIGYRLKGPAAGKEEWVLATASTGKGQRTQLLLSDGSEVYLNSETRLTFPKKMDVQQVMYLEGEAYFNLKNTSQQVTIKTKEIVTTSKSSQINISAFPKDSTVTVSVEKGEAEIRGNNEVWPLTKLVPAKKDTSSAQEEAKPRIMPMMKLIPARRVLENQAMIFDKGSRKAGVTDLTTDESVFNWKDGVISFTNADSATIVNKIQRWFGVRVYLNTSALPVYNAEFKNASLKEVLQHMGETLNVACIIKGDIVYINKVK